MSVDGVNRSKRGSYNARPAVLDNPDWHVGPLLNELGALIHERFGPADDLPHFGDHLVHPVH